MFGTDIKKRIENDFGSSAPSVAEELEKFIESFREVGGTRPGDRVIRCIVHLAEGKREKITYYIKAALGDPRDVMWWAEYDQGGKRIHDYNYPFQNV